ncbi:MAG: HRDC domain-containing protein [bacterium]
MRFFTIPVFADDTAANELNGFLASRRVLSIDRRLIDDGPGSAWAVCVTYLDATSGAAPIKKGKVDYKEVLSDGDFAVFVRLRALRKSLAERDAVPAYAIFTNEQLAAMVER